MRELGLYLLAAFLLQNIVLTTGFGSSLMLKNLRRPKDLLFLGGALTVFATLTVLAVYPVDRLIGSGPMAKMVRPLLIIVISAILYMIAVPILKRVAGYRFPRMVRLLALAAFNNLTIGIALIANHSLSLSLAGSVGLALGTGAGFLAVSWLTLQGKDRTEHSDIPPAFRGLPVTLLYLGILAMALMGFRSGSLI